MATTSPQPPTVPYWHAWTDPAGVSHQTRRELGGLELRVVAEGAAPVWVRSAGESPTSARLAVLPVGLIGRWHENPCPQWIVTLSGRWFAESMDGVRIELGPGDLYLGEDQATHSVDGRRGHVSGAIGNEPAVLILIPFPRPPLQEP